MIDKYDLSNKALTLRKKFGEDGSSPVDIFSLVYTIKNLTLVFYPMGDNISGICIKNNDTPLIAINSSMSLGRQNFSLAHELYHLYFDENNQLYTCAKEIGYGNDIEMSADVFASYFLMPPVALTEKISEIKNDSKINLDITDIVNLEQYFRVSRQALLNRLIDEKVINSQEAVKFRNEVIRSAKKLGYDDSLYIPLSKDKQYKTYGYYIKQANELFQKELISTGKYEELLLSAYRSDLVYDDDLEIGELND
jgi:Zn-dependent peptidase ImmA (M78 family)